MSKVRFVKNPGFEREIQHDAKFAASMVAQTVAAADEVKAAAQPFRHTGYFIRHISTAGTTLKLGDPFWHLIEFGSKNNPVYAPLRRGVRAAGLRLDDARK